MSLRNHIFNAPVAPTYQPAPRIERSMAQTMGILDRGFREEAARQKEQEQQFSNLYNNLGEIEGQLQQNYAGIMQEAVDSTKNFMKDWYKSGKRSTDPEFQMRLGEMTGRIRAGMSNADNIRTQLKQAADIIAKDPAVRDKTGAMTEILSMAQNPDILISRNPVNLNQIVDRYIDPSIVLQDEWKNLPTTGEFEDSFIDPQGNERRSTVLRNAFIGEQPFTEDGQVNLQVPPDYLQAVREGRVNPRVASIFNRIAQEKYSDLPSDVALGAAIKDAFSNVAGINYKTRVARTADQRAKEEAQLRRTNTLTDLAISREQRQLAKQNAVDKQEAETLDRWDKFATGFENMSNNPLLDYTSATMKDFEWDVPREQRQDYKTLQSQEAWEKAGKSERVRILNALGVEVPSTFGVTSSDSEDARKEALSVFEQNFGAGIQGIRFKRKSGTKDGQTQWQEDYIPITSVNDLKGAFEALESMRGIKKGTAKAGEIPQQPTEEDEFEQYIRRN